MQIPRLCVGWAPTSVSLQMILIQVGFQPSSSLWMFWLFWLTCSEMHGRCPTLTPSLSESGVKYMTRGRKGKQGKVTDFWGFTCLLMGFTAFLSRAPRRKIKCKGNGEFYRECVNYSSRNESNKYSLHGFGLWDATSRTVVLSWGGFCLRRTLGIVWRQFCYTGCEGGGQGCCSISHNAQDGPRQQRIIRPQMKLTANHNRLLEFSFWLKWFS